MFNFFSVAFAILFISQIQAQVILDKHRSISFESTPIIREDSAEYHYADFRRKNEEANIIFHYEVYADGNNERGVTDVIYAGKTMNTVGLSGNETKVKILTDTANEFSLEERLNNKVINIYKIAKLPSGKYLLTVIDDKGAVKKIYTQIK